LGMRWIGEPSTKAFVLAMRFYFRRPKTHFNSRGELRAKYAEHHDFRPTGPDVDKLLRTVCDAGTGVIYVDDRQVVRATPEKRWLPYPDAEEGMSLQVQELEGP